MLKQKAFVKKTKAGNVTKVCATRQCGLYFWLRARLTAAAAAADALALTLRCRCCCRCCAAAALSFRAANCGALWALSHTQSVCVNVCERARRRAPRGEPRSTASVRHAPRVDAGVSTLNLNSRMPLLHPHQTTQNTSRAGANGQVVREHYLRDDIWCACPPPGPPPPACLPRQAFWPSPNAPWFSSGQKATPAHAPANQEQTQTTTETNKSNATN